MRIRLGVLIGMGLSIVLLILDIIVLNLDERGVVGILLIVAMNLVLIWLVFRLVWFVVNGSSQGTIGRLWAGGGEPSLRGYSEQESLVARGEMEKAVASYRDRIASNPADLNARLRLGSLLASQGDHAEAEYWFLQVRIVGATAEQEAVLGNSLIDLYRASGERPKLKDELARFARNSPTSEAGQRAQQHLRELNREDVDAHHST